MSLVQRCNCKHQLYLLKGYGAPIIDPLIHSRSANERGDRNPKDSTWLLIRRCRISVHSARRSVSLTSAKEVGLDDAQYSQLAKPGALPLETANGMIENVIGTFELPMAVAGYFQINGKDVIVPMAVEEPSIVAAASFMAKLARVSGGFQTSSTGPLMRAQVQVVGVSDPMARDGDPQTQGRIDRPCE